MALFPVESSVAQLRPETIARLVGEAEERQWSQLSIPGDREEEPDSPSPIHGSAELGNALLRHGTCVKRIQNYFSHLESRKCCLLLAGRRSTFSNVRIVRNDGQDNGLEEGAMTRPTITHTKDVQQLDNKEFRAFKHAYLCAAFPVLGAPDPPSPISPSPTTPTDTNPTPLSSLHPRSGRRPSTPLSLHDSGVEENDEGAMIPTETLCELLRRSFCLSTEKFHQYETIIAKSYHKKSPPKLLAEELFSQLMALENNSNTFYNPAAFCVRINTSLCDWKISILLIGLLSHMTALTLSNINLCMSRESRNGYDIWCHKEMSHISDLLNKFWHFSLPFPSESQLHAKDLTTVHEDYEILLSKLLFYEHQFKVGTEDTSSPLFTLLSSASQRLLREFGLRYGIGEQYRRILYLRHLIEIFSPSMWFLQHMTSVIASIRDLLPSNKSQLVMTKKEFMLLDSCIKSVLIQANKSFCQMRSIFETVRPPDGIEILIGLLSSTLELKSYLFLDSHETLDEFLYKAVQGIFRPAYDRHKILALSELSKRNQTETVCPILLNIMIGNIRDEVIDYRNNYQASFAPYLNITEIAAQSFYILLMEDVDRLCQEMVISSPKQTVHEINLLMLGLAYRLNRLDQDWTEYIPPEAQHWRKLFLHEMLRWASAVQIHVQDLVLVAVSADKFQTQEVHLTTPLSSLTGSATPSHRCPSVSTKSITPSVNSAFSSIVSSVRSSPNRQGSAFESPAKPPWQPATIPESSPESVGPAQEDKDNSPSSKSLIKIGKRGSFDTKSLTEVEDHEEQSKVKGLKQSASLPEMKHKDDGHEEHLDSCPFMPLLNESDEISSKASGLSLNTGEHSKSDMEGSGIVFKAPLHSDEIDEDDDATSSMASEIETLSDGEDTEHEDESFQFPPIQVTNEMHGSNANIIPPVPEADTHPWLFRRVLSAFRSTKKEEHLVTSGRHDSENEYEDRQFRHSVHQAFNQTELESDRHQDFLDSFSSEYSNISFPTPPPGSDASLPVSGSTVDVVVIMQRVVAIARTFYQVLYPTLDDLETLQAVDGGELNMDQMDFHKESLVGKQELYTNFLKTICNTACHFADNMLCLDLCGTSHTTAKKILGPKLVEHVNSQRRASLVWGCRHEVDGKKNCFEYVNKRTAYLCDRYEPVTQQMCTRINNVVAMLKFLEVYERRLASIFGEKDSWLSIDDIQRSRYTSKTGRESCVSMQDFMSGDHQDADREDGESLFDIPRTDSPIVFRLLDPHQSHLLSVLKAQCRLMAYRLNLFLRDAMTLLLSLKPVNTTIQDCLKPVTSFLQTYLEKLSGWLYKDCFHQLLECLWIFLVQDLEVQADRLRLEEDMASSWAQIILQTLTHLLKFMNNFGKGITRNLLLSQADDLIFKLQLYTLSTHQLLALYSKLRDFSLSERGMFPHEVVKPAPAVILQKIQKDLQRFRKCFSGKELIRWIFRNRDLFYRIEPAMVERGQSFSKDTAINIIMKLLDLHYIADLESDISDDSRSPSPTHSGSKYPEVSILSQFQHTSQLHPRTQSSSGCDSEHTPVASPAMDTSPGSSQDNSSSDSERATPVASHQNRQMVTDEREHGDRGPITTTHTGGSPVENESGDAGSSVTKEKENGVSSRNLSETSGTDDIHSQCRGTSHYQKKHESNCDTGSGDKDENSSKNSSHKSSLHTKHQSTNKKHITESLPTIQDHSSDASGKLEKTKMNNYHRSPQPTQRQSPITDSSHYLSSVESAPMPLMMTRQHLLNSMSSGLSRSTLLTPLSFRSDTPFTSFIDSPNKFFHVVPLAVEETNHYDIPSLAFDSYIKENNQRFIRLSRSRETADMVEKCFQKKIKPVFLLSVLYGRRKSDPIAKTFVRLLPAKVVDRIKYLLQKPAVDAV